MNKKELVSKVAERAQITQAKAAEIVNIFFSCEQGTGIIADEIAAGGVIVIPGFGKFSKNHRGARPGVNLQTKEKITIPARDYPAFKAGKTLKERM